MEATIFDRTSASLDGQRVDVSEGQDVYRALLAIARQRAAAAGQPVELRAQDRTRGTTDTLIVQADGRVEHHEAPRTGAPTPPTPPPTMLGSANGTGVHPLPIPATAAHQAPPSFVKERKEPPQHGWRRAVHALSGGAINVGPSSAERHEQELIAQVRTRASRPAVIVVMCLKGGIGKTSTTAGVGLTLARHRGDRVIALDANPDAGDLYERTCGTTPPATLTDLADYVGSIAATTDLAHYIGIADRLSVVAGDQEPTISESLSAEDFVAALRVIQRYYNVVMVDCGTGVTHPSMVGVLSNADCVVIAGGYAVSGARRAENTLRWLHANGYQSLARNATVVLTQTTNVSAVVDRGAIEAALAQLSATVITVPHDQAVADGATIRLDDLRAATQQAYLEIAAALARQFQ